MNPDESTPTPTVAWSTAVAFWFKLGWISFGGPAGQIALMHQELVERRGWISEARFLHALNYCMLLPGPEAQQLATYIGWRLHGVRGGVVAGVLFVLPSLLILVGLSWLYLTQGDQPWAVALLNGIKPAVVALIVAAAWRMGQRVLRVPLAWALAASAFIGLSVLRVPFAGIILGAALLGWAVHRAGCGHWLNPGPASASSAPASASAPAPAPAPFVSSPGARSFPPDLRRQAMRMALVCLALWALVLGLLALAFGPHGTLVQMAGFFTQAALLTFGGAYAVLPFVVEGAVHQHQWLSAAQMMDGLALGETTPGPLIMVVAFVGFLGGWGQALFGEEQRLLAGAVAATVATVFTFLPSFLFILAGAPLVDRVQGLAALDVPLKAITAAVVGVILSLGLWFAQTVLWPSRLDGAADPVALLAMAVAIVLLVGLRWGVVPVLGLSALSGALQGALMAAAPV